MNDYEPIDGFYDLRDFNIPTKEFPKFVRVQKCLASYERARKSGTRISNQVKELSAQYQQALFAYENIKKEVNT